MVLPSGVTPSFVRMGELSISTVVNDNHTVLEAKQRIKLSDGKEMTVTVQFAAGTDKTTIEKKMNVAIVKMVDIAILHELGNPERSNPTSRLVLKGENVLEKHYLEAGKQPKTITNYIENLQNKADKLETQLSSSSMNQCNQVLWNH